MFQHTEGSQAFHPRLSTRPGPSKVSQSRRYRLHLTSEVDPSEAEGLGSLMGTLPRVAPAGVFITRKPHVEREAQLAGGLRP